MSLGLSGKLNVLHHSPHDLATAPALADPAVASRQHWVASRYTVRATAEDGRLILWNSLSGKITAIKAQDREAVLGLLTRSGFEAPKAGVVKYLVDRGYLVRKDADEYRKFQQTFGQQHYRSDVLELILMPSEDCNFRCTYCYEDFKRGTMLPEVREGLKNLVRQRIKKLNRLHISWFGGEPLYGFEAIEDLAPFFVEIAKEHEVFYSSQMTTNGYLLTPEVFEKLLAWRVTSYQITMDGLAEHHNHSRIARDGSPTFERIFENLKAMAQRDDSFHVTLRVNIDRSNSAGLPEFLDMLAAEFSDDPRFVLHFKTVGKWGGSNDANLDVCTSDESAYIREAMTAQALQNGLRVESFKDIARVGSQVCYAARPYNLLVGATGKIMKCTIVLDKEDYNIVGRVLPDGMLQIDADRMSLWTEPAFESDTQCQKCVVLPTCSGISCPLIRIESGNRPCIEARTTAKASLVKFQLAPATTGRTKRIEAPSS